MEIAMTHEEKVGRLKSMLDNVAGPDGLESLATPPGGLESMAEGPVAEAQNALDKLRTGQPLSPAESFGLEAIILPDLRPVVFIHNDKFDPVPMNLWSHLNKDDVHARLDPLFSSIGRVEVPNTPSIAYGGTAFVVGDNLLMTNRHVARLFSDGLGRQTNLVYHTNGSVIDFKREDGMSDPDVSTLLKVTGVAMIHPYWDMALLSVTGLPALAKPLKLSVEAPESLANQDVVVVGYPARDYRNDFAVQDRVFQSKYGVKRMQPGKIQTRERVQSFENFVDAITHDSSTLGGNSGSAIIHVASGTVVGLHFAGVYLKANYGVPTHELGCDSRVVNAGVNFQKPIPAATNVCDPAWVSIGEESPRPTPTPPAPQPPPVVPIPALIGSGAASFVVPLHISVSIGAPAVPAAALSVAASTAAVAEVEIEKVPVIFPDLEEREGYQEDFLGFDDVDGVPMPKLTAAGRTNAAKLEDGSPVLNYHKFSVVMHKRRRMALFTAANVDWRPEVRKVGGKKPTRKELDGFTGNEREDWVTDPRIPLDHQLPDYFYTKDGGAFDKGHLVRRDDVAWGDGFEDMQKGNGDTFHTTNCSPQTAGFNRANPSEFNWGALENMVQQRTSAEKVCVFSGPVLDKDDRYFHGLVKGGAKVSIQIPRRYWKIIVANNDGKPAAFGFVLDQELSDVDLHAEMAVPNAWRKYMRPISEIEAYLNGLAKLTWFKPYDQSK
jgi:endonuclease G